MKKVILTAAIALSVLFGISTTTYAATSSKEEVSTVLTDVSNISEIEVHGNVQVYLTSASDDKVKVYNNYYADNALVQEESGVLRITSYSTDKQVVWVNVKNLSKLTVYDDAAVKSFGKFSAIDLNVTLFGDAVAQLDMDAFSASFTVTGHSKADLSGSVANGTLAYTGGALVNTSELAATSMTRTLLAQPKPRFHHMGEFAAL